MSKRTFIKQSQMRGERFNGKHRFEHWYVDDQMYLVTGCTREHFPAFESELAKQVFWMKFEQYTREFDFTPWACSLLNTHYHFIGHNARAQNFPLMMQRLHGSVAKLVNDLLPERRTDFWRDTKGREYWDGCLRNEEQIRRSFRYVCDQAVRAGIVERCDQYSHTRIYLDSDRAMPAVVLRAIMPDVPYHRYD